MLALWRSHKLLLIAFMLAAVLTIGFGVRMLLFSVYWSDPDHQNQPLESWMTPRYVALSYKIERDDVRKIFGIEQSPETRMTLQSIAKLQGVTLEAMQSQLDAFVVDRLSK